MAFMFENLEVYQKSVDLADDVLSSTADLPAQYRFLADQFNRAALSIAANRAEGSGLFTKPDRCNFFLFSRGSTQECVPLLEIARRRGLVSDPTAADLKNCLEVIAKMISGLIAGFENRKK